MEYIDNISIIMIVMIMVVITIVHFLFTLANYGVAN